MSTGDFRVADISLADFGRKEIELAEHEVCCIWILELYPKFDIFLICEDAWSYGVQT